MNTAKKHILKTGLMLFLQKSYRDVTMQEIVKATGLSKGAFYHYFSSKEDLFKEIAGSFFILGRTDYDSLPQDSFKDFYKAYARLIGKSLKQMMSLAENEEKPEPSINYFFILFEAIKRFPEFAKLERQIYHKDLEVWSKVIQSAKAKGEITSTSQNEEIAELFLSCIDGIFIQLFANNKTGNFRKKTLQMFDIIYSGLNQK